MNDISGSLIQYVLGIMSVTTIHFYFLSAILNYERSITYSSFIQRDMGPRILSGLPGNRSDQFHRGGFNQIITDKRLQHYTEGTGCRTSRLLNNNPLYTFEGAFHAICV
jgi:hypothetical protein